MRPVTRGLITAVVYLGVLAVIVVAAFFAVMVLAGPHSGLLPGWMEPVVLIIGWLIVLVIPAWVAFLVWRKLGPRAGPG